ncbi:PadR family transcriptional regulator [Actinoplanes sp. NPDC051475]|uniref:PadR family transcriptional regulator n=1 Tax=Actinoplanes sp. NPDC051475 TaxID=3157225 RepID=UPI00344EDCE2
MTDGPLREPTFLVLTALAERPQHGYAVIEDVARMTDGRVRLRAGTLYAALDRLRTEGLIEVDREEVVQSRLRRYYRLSGLGEQRLAAETSRLRQQATLAERRLSARRHVGGAPAPAGGVPG